MKESISKVWSEGLTLIEEGRYWEAHEALEVVWLTRSEGAERDAVQALIQFAAAAYKVDQAADGRSEASMQRGMRKLIDSARTLLADHRAGQVSWDIEALETALDELEQVHVYWGHEGTTTSAAERALHIAERLVGCIR